MKKPSARHADGSAQVAVILREAGAEAESQAPNKLSDLDSNSDAQPKRRGRPTPKPPKKISTLSVREVRGKVFKQASQQWVEVRLWTSLSPSQADAGQLLGPVCTALGAGDLLQGAQTANHAGDLLKSQRTDTAIQHIAALMIAASLLAEECLA